MSLLIGDKLVVTIHYTLTDESGEVIDSSEGADPLAYLHGAGNLIPGLERELLGKTAGASLKTTVSPEDRERVGNRLCSRRRNATGAFSSAL